MPSGQGELLREGDDLTIVAIGATVYPALEAAKLLKETGNPGVSRERPVREAAGPRTHPELGAARPATS